MGRATRPGRCPGGRPPRERPEMLRGAAPPVTRCSHPALGCRGREGDVGGAGAGCAWGSCAPIRVLERRGDAIAKLMRAGALAGLARSGEHRVLAPAKCRPVMLGAQGCFGRAVRVLWTRNVFPLPSPPSPALRPGRFGSQRCLHLLPLKDTTFQY